MSTPPTAPTVPLVALVDNGSLRPAATLQLRAVARALSAHAGIAVAPVSLLHSDAVDPAALGGTPAETLEPWIVRHAAEGTREFVVLPYFLGPSRAFSVYLPERVAELKRRWPDLRVRVAPNLVDPADETDERMAAMLEARVDETLAAASFGPGAAAVAVVDHGSPEPRVTAVRDLVARQLARRLGPRVRAVAACSMERRDGPEYAFNEPLLAALLDAPPFNAGPVVVAMLFLSPGRHAGPGGDVAQICAAAQARHPGLRPIRTGLLGDRPELIPLLADRLAQGRVADCL
jgi:sirohydrochlorin ferrochelatase